MKLIPVAKPYVTKEDERAVARTVASRWVLQGPRVVEFEGLLQNFIHTPHAVATNSCTAALHMSLLLLGIGPGDDVLVPSYSYIATTNAVIHAGATPVFVDIDPNTYNIDPVDIKKKITKKTRAIIPVHQIGLPADMKAIKQIAKVHNLVVIEDAACALGSYIDSKHVGRFGDIGCFSFHPRKAITTAEGGLLIARSSKIAKHARMLRAHGANHAVSTRHKSRTVSVERYPVVGYNYRMSDVHASLGITQFQKLTLILKKRREIAKRYTHAWHAHDRIVTPFVPHGFTHNWQSYMIRVRGLTTKTQEALMQKLLDDGIATRRSVMAAHMEPVYRSRFPKLKLPETELALHECIILPLFPELTKSDQNRVIESLSHTLKKL